MIDYLTVLGTGEANAIKGKDLAERLGFSDSRILQADIAKARKNGVMILSSSAGYFLPADNAEVQRFVNTLTNRALHTLQALRTAKRYLRQTPGQIEMTS